MSRHTLTHTTRHSVRQIAANKTRLLLTAFAVVLSTAFVAAAFTLGDGYSGVIYGWGAGQSSGLDAMVEPETAFTALNFEINPRRVDHDTLEQIRTVDGVAAARPVLWTDELIRPTLPNGDLVPNRLSVTTYGWVEGSTFHIVDGQAPSTGQFMVDSETAAANDFVPGTVYDVATPTGALSLELSGLMEFKPNTGTTAGQVLLAMNMTELQDVLGSDGYLRVDVNGDADTNPSMLKSRLEQVLDPELAVSTQEEYSARLREQVGPFAVGFRAGLLGFALISVFVSAFIIHNTFTMLMARRIRELGLLRAVGATPRQIRTMILLEGAVLGVVASVLGTVAGLGLSHLLSNAMRALTGLPAPELQLTIPVAGLSVGVGVVMTLVAATAPARRAGKVPVMEALGAGHSGNTGSSKVRLVGGGLLVALGIGAVAMALGVLVSNQSRFLTLAAAGVAIFLGVAMLNALWITPVTRLLGWPVARIGAVPGRLARANISRHPERSSTTAASLMVGLALVSMVLVVGDSVKHRLVNGTADAYRGDHVVANDDGYRYDASLATRLEALDSVAEVATLSFDAAAIDGKPQPITVGDHAKVDRLIDFDLVDPDPDPDAVNARISEAVFVSADEAERVGLRVGDTVPVTFFNGAETSLTVTGVYGNTTPGVGNYYVNRSVWEELADQSTIDVVAIRSASGVSDTTFRTEIDRFILDNPQVTVRTTAEHVADSGDSVQETLGIVNMLMALAILISFLGIANTLALSIAERTREIGLLRAVGMTAAQVRRMVRYEAALIATFGAVVGTIIGMAFGAGLVVALPRSIVGPITVPAAQLSMLVTLAALAGLCSAAVPAWRAGRSPALRSINS